MASISLLKHLEGLPDPRMERTKRHQLLDIVTIAICAALSGCDEWTQVETFGRENLAWFKRFLALPHGIPSHDTFGRVFRRLEPKAFEEQFEAWTRAVSEALTGAVAVDGKTLCGSRDGALGKAGIHLVSAWACENRLMLGQVKTEEKSNEITAIPELLRVLALKGCLVTVDAMGCQTEIARTIVERGADYLLAVKANQGTLFEDIEQEFQAARAEEFAHLTYTYHKTQEKNRGRIEVRECWSTPDVEGLDPDGRWAKLSGMVMCRNTRTLKDKVEVKTRYYITSRKGLNAQAALAAVRGHWGIENRLHWVLDTAFQEDASRIQKDHGPQNMALVKRWALNLLRADQATKGSVKTRRLMAGWNKDYLLKLLTRQHY